ncbi:MAG: hypothetical protein WC661_02515 [Opitutaceae bacterium]|jgi:hypothetical protein
MSFPGQTASRPRTLLFWAAVILLVAACSLVEACWARPMVWADSAAGFHVWDSMRAGAAWNCYVEPDPANIAKNHEVFRTWWSPGQYMPAGLLTLAGPGLGEAVIVVTLAGILAGLAGCWRLFKAWEFPEPVAMASVALIALGWHTSFLFGMFNGGELALFAGFPWIAWAATRLADKPAWLPAALPPLFLIGAFLKLSFPVVALALCAGLWLGRNDTPWRIDVRALRLAGALGAGFAVFYAVLWAFFLSLGPTPGEAGQVVCSWPLAVGFSFTGPLLATGAFGSLISRAVFFPGAPLLTSWDQLGGVLCLLSAPAVALYALAWKNAPGARYRGMVAGFVIGYAVLFAWLYYRGASISMDDRHFRPAAIVLIPGLVQAGRMTRRAWLRRLLIAAALLAVLYGLAGFVNRVRYIRNVDNVGVRGFTQSGMSRSATALVHSLDLTAPATDNSIFYVTSPGVALDVSRVRTIRTHAEQESPSWLRSMRYKGRVDNLLVIKSAGTSAAQTAAVLGSFVSYDQSAWQFHDEGDCRFYYQGAWLDSVLHGKPAPAPQP